MPSIPTFKRATLQVGDLSTNTVLQCREAMSEAAVLEYLEVLENGGELDPIEVCEVDADYFVTDGHHRLEAHRRFGSEDVKVHKVRGSMDLARMLAARANTKHGLKRSNEDKRRQIRICLETAEGGKWSDREIARWCGVSADLVGSVRRSLSESTVRNGPPPPQTRTYTTKHGTVAEMNTSNIGKKGPPPPVTPKPVPKDELGNDLPDDPEVREAFAEAYRFDQIAREISELLLEIEGLRESPAGREMHMLTLESDLKAARTSLLKFGKPYCVCPAYPQCTVDGACSSCKGRKWLTKQQRKILDGMSGG